MARSRGEKPRPRGVLLGAWEENLLRQLMSLFPTAYAFATHDQMNAQLISDEMDVLVCAPGSFVAHDRARAAHTIVFGPSTNRLPGPASTTVLHIDLKCVSEEHDIMNVPPLLEGPLKRWVSEFEDPRGMFVIDEVWPGSYQGPARPNGLADIGLVMARSPWAPLAVQWPPDKNRRGLAWFPNAVSNVVDWVRALLHLWAERDPDRLPGLRDWEMQPPWMTLDELALTADLQALRARRRELLDALALEESSLEARLLAARDGGNRGPRLILTSQGNELVDACEKVLTDIGFTVRNMDRELPSGASKREDLRITTALEPDWEAIVEIKGYARSGGKSADLHQLTDHAGHFAAETRHLPNKRIYIVNGEIETSITPGLRRLPFSKEDLEVFVPAGGLVLPTPELFKLHRDLERVGREAAQRLIVDALGVFTF